MLYTCPNRPKCHVSRPLNAMPISISDPATLVFQLNGEAVSIPASCSPQTTLLDFLRARGLTGAKEGCAEGECGACTVVMVRDLDGRTVYRPVNSCLMFLPMAAGQEVYTVEALAASGSLHPVQQSMVDHGGSQCGYCTPGFVMSLFAEHYRPGRGDGACDPHSMGGNLCRCTGYRPIRDAALALTAAPPDAFSRRLDAPAPPITAIASAHFSRPATLDDCLAILARDPDARIVSGGTDLGVESNLLGRAFPHLVSVEAIPDLRIFHETAREIEIGAALTLSEIEAAWKTAPAAFTEWLDLFASPLIRNRATLGGNLATASPIGDGAPFLLALDAAVRIAGASGTRTVPLHEFFLDYRKTALARAEILVSIVIPKPVPPIVFYKVAKRRLDDISTIAAAFSITLGAASRVTAARLAYGGVAPVPLRCIQAEDILTGSTWNRRAVQQACAAIAATLRPISDHRGSAEYRLALAQSLLEKFFYECSEAAE
ncbi:MAG: molybdopterin dehydrogenase, FAD-binding [Candidatus Solibacter sp.]|nr:molybdopterin dehydrogenase, FAD-binding [Candidatus Solibacter sp.]